MRSFRGFRVANRNPELVWKPPVKPKRGYTKLYVERVTQADQGCDFDFLAGGE